ncbi:hypothetical protein C8R44DRAFT_729121 [Mycena epipterygia]|nr:hypothetical protein C8R44DRAFT_729121 [Mycena epipterygia]
MADKFSSPFLPPPLRSPSHTLSSSAPPSSSLGARGGREGGRKGYDTTRRGWIRGTLAMLCYMMTCHHSEAQRDRWRGKRRSSKMESGIRIVHDVAAANTRCLRKYLRLQDIEIYGLANLHDLDPHWYSMGRAGAGSKQMIKRRIPEINQPSQFRKFPKKVRQLPESSTNSQPNFNPHPLVPLYNTTAHTGAHSPHRAAPNLPSDDNKLMLAARLLDTAEGSDGDGLGGLAAVRAERLDLLDEV